MTWEDVKFVFGALGRRFLRRPRSLLVCRDQTATQTGVRLPVRKACSDGEIHGDNLVVDPARAYAAGTVSAEVRQNTRTATSVSHIAASGSHEAFVAAERQDGAARGGASATCQADADLAIHLCAVARRWRHDLDTAAAFALFGSQHSRRCSSGEWLLCDADGLRPAPGEALTQVGPLARALAVHVWLGRVQRAHRPLEFIQWSGGGSAARRRLCRQPGAGAGGLNRSGDT